jgi:hypothetical protein
MPVDKEEKFDKMLCRALQGHSEVVPADFTDRMLRRIREAENSRILARLVMEERLTLAGCIVLGIMAIVMVSVFPGVAVSFKEWFGRLTILSGVEGLAGTFIDKITRTIEAVRYDWRSYMVFAGVFGFAVCSLVDLLVSDS